MIFKVHFIYFDGSDIIRVENIKADGLKYEEGMITFYKKSGVKIYSSGNKEIDYNFVMVYPMNKVVKIEAISYEKLEREQEEMLSSFRRR